MQQGNWVPLSKALVRKLPTNREFSEVEAMFSLAVDYDCNNPASVSGMASRWGWSRKRVSNFLKKHGLQVFYEGKFNRHKKGQVGYQVGDRKGAGREQVEFIDSRQLGKQGNRRGTGGEQEGNRKGSNTKEPNPKPEPNPKEKNNNNKPSIKDFDPITLREEWIPEKDWLDLISHRKNHKKKPPQTERAYKAIIKELSKASENGFTVTECVDALSQSTWQTFKACYMDNRQPSKKSSHSQEDKHNGFDSRDYSKDATSTEDLPDFLR